MAICKKSDKDSPLYEPEFITFSLDHVKGLRRFACLNEKHIWTCDMEVDVMKLYDTQGSLQCSVQTETGTSPYDIAVAGSGELVYTDVNRKTVYMMKNSQIEEIIRLNQWTPLNVCITSSGDLLVTMSSANFKEFKVSRYRGNTDIQSIQFDEEDRPLYSSGYLKYICENKNQDVCVADCREHAVVVVNEAGKLRFRYTGNNAASKGAFDPYGIATDSQGDILTADCNSHCIHILDQDGQFLRYIDNCELRTPRELCVDPKDNLFVTEYYTGDVTNVLKKIKYKP
ncbi:tripartite motif-containing protein 2-like [Saccostrea echinata]|uniref:tripartite motif-containing protein 2-like n=1 Tax=Saccostrea echinata TaxID=191078 RepID=UPI002A7FD11B|nr:tripartite motif-containing protein 2-like [Saccostrea echinata]